MDDGVGRAARIARQHAADVDRQGRFPAEAIAALAKERLLTAAVHERLGGLGWTLAQVCRMVSSVGQACASSATILAMHQIQVYCILRHAGDSDFFGSYLHELCETQALLASATSEVGVGGDLRRSSTAVDVQGEQFTLRKRCSAISYWEHADAILVTARRHAAAGNGDQVLALVRRRDCDIRATGTWDAMGLRGTCTPPAELDARAPVQQILRAPFAEIAAMTMVPTAHVLWTSGWLGLATDAVRIAHRIVRADASAAAGLPLGARPLAEAHTLLQAMACQVDAGVRELQAHFDDPDNAVEHLFSPAYAVRSNALKLSASRLVVRICRLCMQASGFRAFSNAGPHSLSRHLRDALGTELMIANERMLLSNAGLLIAIDPDSTDDLEDHAEC